MSTQTQIIVGVDGSWRQTGALEWALDEALLRRTPLRAVHVVDRRQPSAGPVDLDGETFLSVRLDEAAMKLADDVAHHVEEAGPEVHGSTDVLVGSPPERLAELGADATMLVVGRRGLGTFGRLLIGSTSDAVAHRGEGPVVVVPDEWKPVLHRDGPIVAGVDGEDPDTEALEFAFEAARVHKVPLWLVHLWDVPAVYAWDAIAIAGVQDRWREMAGLRLDMVADQWQDKYPDVDVRREVLQAHAVLGLLEFAGEQGAQLLVVGGRPHNRVSGLLLGSVARGVLHHATCPVAVVHERRAP
jgi:nucleotide-binding universal stress UspA family protein